MSIQIGLIKAGSLQIWCSHDIGLEQLQVIALCIAKCILMHVSQAMQLRNYAQTL